MRIVIEGTAICLRRELVPDDLEAAIDHPLTQSVFRAVAIA
jgi:hypothetical protein